MHVPTPERGVPGFVVDNPAIVEQAFGDDLRIPLADIVAATHTFVETAVPGYLNKITKPTTALSAEKGNCVARAALIHGLASNFDHIQSGIIFKENHALNVVVEKQGNKGFVIDNLMELEHGENEYTQKGKLRLSTFSGIHSLDEAHVLNSVFIATIYKTYQMREQTSGVFDIWSLSVAGAVPSRALPEKPQNADMYDETELRKRSVLLGRSATYFVNSLTGHTELMSQDHEVSADVSHAIEALGPDVGIRVAV